ncbi:adenylyl-sulfate kinase [Sphaerisporangium fuscum]|uniref:adenylyl-sulfate kinase n=1 Tax=Sphaerisporangium fuscum TaxID=2835868 RepID=UPI002542D6E4|nr:adenylyl-sulfate kinase [Sphaerisporangium fuscum]
MTRRFGRVVWITGLSGAGKTTVSKLIAAQLNAEGINPVILDGDTIRQALPDLPGFDERSRRELAACYGRLAGEFAAQGHVVLCATVSMFHSAHAWNRANLPGYLEIWLRVPPNQLSGRDTKGVYGSGDQVVGMEIEPEFPREPDLVIDNYASVSPEEAAARVHALITGAR